MSRRGKPLAEVSSGKDIIDGDVDMCVQQAERRGVVLRPRHCEGWIGSGLWRFLAGGKRNVEVVE